MNDLSFRLNASIAPSFALLRMRVVGWRQQLQTEFDVRTGVGGEFAIRPGVRSFRNRSPVAKTIK